MLVDLHLLLDLVDVDVGNIRLVAINDLGELLERGALGLDVHEEDKDELGGDPALFITISICCARRKKGGE